MRKRESRNQNLRSQTAWPWVFYKTSSTFANFGYRFVKSASRGTRALTHASTAVFPRFDPWQLKIRCRISSTTGNVVSSWHRLSHIGSHLLSFVSCDSCMDHVRLFLPLHCSRFRFLLLFFGEGVDVTGLVRFMKLPHHNCGNLMLSVLNNISIWRFGSYRRNNILRGHIPEQIAHWLI